MKRVGFEQIDEAGRRKSSAQEGALAGLTWTQEE
jgi:hypothetical protein